MISHNLTHISRTHTRTGLPHYGHILAGTIKDTVTRYAAQTGHYVSRRAGWDCHGLPVEYEIDQQVSEGWVVCCVLCVVCVLRRRRERRGYE